VAKGSAVNKLILVPAALVISALVPWAVMPLMMLGGAFLCYEGCEKLAHRFLHSAAEDAAEHAALTQAVADPAVDLVAFEREKIKGAIRTDFILSAEIIVITLGVVATAPIGTRIAVLAGIAVLMTIGVYGLVAGIVKLDDAGLSLSRSASASLRAIGRGILAAAPWLMKFLSVAGTAAMFLVGGGILTHSVPALVGFAESLAAAVAGWPVVGVPLAAIMPVLVDGIGGLVAGAIVLAAVMLVRRAFARAKATA